MTTPNLQQLQDQVKDLRARLDKAMADMEKVSTLDEYNQALVDFLDELKSRTGRAAPAPVNHVTVQPAPVTVMPAASDFEIHHEYDADGHLCRSHVKRVKT